MQNLDFTKKEEYFDLTIKSNDHKELYFSKFLLMNLSPLVLSIFTDDQRTEKSNEIYLDIMYDDLIFALKFISEFDRERKVKHINLDNVFVLLKILDYLLVDKKDLEIFLNFIIDNLEFLDLKYGFLEVISNIQKY